MLPKDIKFGSDARDQILIGANTLANAVKTTLGPRGRNVMIDKGPFQMPRITKDGVTVAREISLKNKFQNMGAQTLREVASKTCDKAGDGPQPLWSKILTPHGFVTMGDMKEGMEICGTDGSIQTVLGVFPKGEREIYNVRFSNGRSAQCCEDHLWSVIINNGTSLVVPLKDMVDDFFKITTAGDRRYKYYIPSTFVEFVSDTKNMPLDPYLVGVLLGDGSLSGSGSIEISLGKSKEHILEKIVLPEGLTKSVKYVDKKNYFRVKITGKTVDGLTASDFVARIGLLGTTSDDKYIPKSYLYSSKEHRELLLQGLIDTDGYINNRGLFEFSTVSDRLANDFRSLVLSLGKFTTFNIHNRDNDLGSYSCKPIFRLQQLKGFKYGTKIVDIKPTGEFTEMQCIKVSNPDSLYITDDFIVTHNTTTATVLAQAIFTEGNKAVAAGMNPIDLKRGIDSAVVIAVGAIKARAKPVVGREDWVQVATISANGDTEVGEKIADAIAAVGRDGVVTVEENKGRAFELEIVDGMQFDRGFLSPYFVNQQEKMVCEFTNPLILIFDKKLSSLSPIVPLLEMAIHQDKPLLIIADDVEGEALAMLVLNKMNAGKQFCAVRAPGFGPNKRDYLEDVAALTGGRYICEETGLRAESATSNVFGRAAKVIVTKDTTTIVGGMGEKDVIGQRCTHIRSLIEESQSEYQKDMYRERLAKMTGGVAVLKVGGSTELELKERRDRVDDALHATRAAVEEGIVPGGGTALLYASLSLDGVKGVNDDQTAGIAIVRKALQAPIRQIAENAGLDGVLVAGRVLENKDFDMGFDAQKLRYTDLMAAGIVDPVKVVRTALQDAASVAGLLITTEVLISELPPEEKDKK